jgi:hypothetical protein
MKAIIRSDSEPSAVEYANFEKVATWSRGGNSFAFYFDQNMLAALESSLAEKPPGSDARCLVDMLALKG